VSGPPSRVFRGGDLLGKRLRHDERGHLAEGHMDLVGVDAQVALCSSSTSL
jgi:hypothetical protein